MSNKDSVSKFISLVLRHKPELINSKLDKFGWMNVDELIKGIQKQKPDFTMKDLEDIVTTDKKTRYKFNPNKTKIRANQGHSVDVHIEMNKPVEPPEFIYHGTSSRFMDKIREDGICSMNRLYVHLSLDKETAVSVGKRHGGNLVVLQVDVHRMIKDGYEFFISDNGVYLVDHVPFKYVTIIE